MRFLIAYFAMLFLLFGCLGEPAKELDFEDELVFEDVSLGEWGIADLDTSEVDAVFETEWNATLNESAIAVVYFQRPGCSACVLMNQWIEQEKKKYNSSVAWYEYDISNANNMDTYNIFADAYGVPQNEQYVPMAYIDGEYFWGIDGIRNGLGKAIDDCIAYGCESPFERLKD